LVAAAVYRAANTLDAMVGYRGRYEYVGKFAARFDDVLNWVPARVTALMLLLASALCRLRVRQAWRVAWREHGATESPNAGWPMALAAGALGVELSKRESYVLGVGLSAPDVVAIAACERLIRVGFGLFTMVASATLIGVGYVVR
jgi:cobalamin biosynthesis protein CobD/CbiB